MPEAAATDLDRRAHRVESGLRRQHPDVRISRRASGE
jgi:hypothetical protein